MLTIRRPSWALRLFTAAILVAQTVWPPALALANPNGAEVVAGAATIATQGNTLNITTHTDRAVVNWNSFSIGANEITNITQPGANSAILNRVTGGNLSAIHGQLNSNGNVFLINPNGVLIGPSGIIATNGFTASTFDIGNQEFMRGGDLTFQGDSKASIINQGVINTGTGGAALIGHQIINSGTITSNGGNITLATGGSVTLNDGSRVIQADIKTIANGISETAPLIKSSGGTIRATGAVKTGGEVYLVGPGSKVVRDTLIAASKVNTQGQTAGGKVVVTGDTVELASANIDASGQTGGGTVNIGGGKKGRDPAIANALHTTVDKTTKITANATSAGNGGQVILWADGTMDFRGVIENRGSAGFAGGFAEVSGLEHLGFHGQVDTGGGELLLDPFTYTINAAQRNAIRSALANNSVTIDTTADVAAFGSSGNNADAGDIIVNAGLFYDSRFDLTFLATGDVIFNASVQNRNRFSSGARGDINIVAGWDGATPFNVGTFNGADITNTTLFGNNQGSVFVGDGTQTTGIAVGSRNGFTRVYGHDVNVQAGSGDDPGRFAQLGFQLRMIAFATDIDGNPLATTNNPNDPERLNPSIFGDIRVRTTNDVSVRGGTAGPPIIAGQPVPPAPNNFAKIGHIGVELGSSFTGIPNETAVAGADIRLDIGNEALFIGGLGRGAYVQLGHGVNLAANGRGVGDLDGDISVNALSDIFFGGGNAGAYAQFGHGRISIEGNHSGDLAITQAGDVAFEGGQSVAAYGLMGHGGNNVNGDHEGDVSIANVQNIRFSGGTNFRSFGQMGHGGYQADGSREGNITINGASDLLLAATTQDSYGQIGHGGTFNNFVTSAGTLRGDITITGVRGDINIGAANAPRAYAQVGHGGASANANMIGDISIDHEGNFLNLLGRNTTDRYAAIGHGNAPGESDFGRTSRGDVTIQTRGSIALTRGIIGHTIDESGNYAEGQTFIGVNGDLTTDGNSRFTSASQANGGELRLYLRAFDNDRVDPSALLNGVAHGPAPAPNFQGAHEFGEGPYNPAAGTNFGYYLFPTFFNYEINATEAANIIAALAGDGVTLASDLNQPQFGAIPDLDGGTQFINVNSEILYDSPEVLNFLATGDITFNASVQNEGSGDINIVAGYDLANVFNAASFAAADVCDTMLFGLDGNPHSAGSIFIGDGNQTIGIAVGSANGNTNAFGHDINLRGSDSAYAFAQLGFHHLTGGAAGSTITTGDINIRTTGSLTARGGTHNAAQGSTRPASNVQVGHGGNRRAITDSSNTTSVNYLGDISIATAEDIVFTTGRNGATAHLGNGGLRANGNHETNITVFKVNNIQFVQGTGPQESAAVHFGTGGLGLSGNQTGDISINATGDITFAAGGSNNSPAHLGNGGNGVNGNHRGDIEIIGANNISLTSNRGIDSYAKIGNGGAGANGIHAGKIEVTTSGDLSLSTPSPGDFTQVGHGGSRTNGNELSGNIKLRIGGDLDLNNRGFFTIIGHTDSVFDFDAGESVAGDIQISVGGTATLSDLGRPDFVKQAIIGHVIGPNGDYLSGKTHIAVGTRDFSGTNTVDALIANAESRIASAARSVGGELRIYVPGRSNFQMADGSTLNGVDVNSFNDTTPFPNEQGGHAPFNGPYNVDLADGNFAFYFGTIELIVNANSGSAIYGDPNIPNLNPGLSLAAGSGDLNAGDTFDSIGLSSSFNLTQTSNAGTYTLEVVVDPGGLDPSYELVGTNNGTFTINKAPLTITAKDLSKVYGTDLTNLQAVLGRHFEVNTSQLENGEVVTGLDLASLGFDSNASVAGGPYEIVPSNPIGRNGFNPDNYDFQSNFVHGRLSVTKAPLVIRPDDQMKTYGDLFTFDGTEFSSRGLKNNETIGSVTLQSAATPKMADAGDYRIGASNPTGGTFDINNYVPTFVPGVFTVKPAPLAITPKSQMKEYGNELPVDDTQFVVRGLKNDDQVLGVALRTPGRPATADAGQYDITATGITRSCSFKASNYSILLNTLIDGLTVKPAPLAITPKSQMKEYGEVLPVDDTQFVVRGLKNDDQVLGVALRTPGRPATADVGQYDITATGITRSRSFKASNYNILLNTLIDGLTVKPAPLLIIPNDQFKPARTQFVFDPTSDFTPIGLKNSDTVGAVTLISPGAAPSALVGLYPIGGANPTGGTFNPNNYRIRFTRGTMIVAPWLDEFAYDNFVREQDQWRTLKSIFTELNEVGDITYGTNEEMEGDEENLAEQDSFDVYGAQ